MESSESSNNLHAIEFVVSFEGALDGCLIHLSMKTETKEEKKWCLFSDNSGLCNNLHARGPWYRLEVFLDRCLTHLSMKTEMKKQKMLPLFFDRNNVYCVTMI